MITVPFTQYVRPNGRTRPIEIDVPDEVGEKALKVIERGGKFEAECIDGDISLTCHYEDEDIAIELCRNGPEVPKAVETLIENAFMTQRFI